MCACGCGRTVILLCIPCGSAALSAGRGAGVGCESESLCWSPSACVARFGDARVGLHRLRVFGVPVYVSHRYLAGRGGDVGRGAGRGVSSIDLLLFVRRGGRDG